MAYPNYGKPKKVTAAGGASRPTKGSQNTSPRIAAQGSNSHVKGYTKKDGTRVHDHFRKLSAGENKMMNKYFRNKV